MLTLSKKHEINLMWPYYIVAQKQSKQQDTNLVIFEGTVISIILKFPEISPPPSIETTWCEIMSTTHMCTSYLLFLIPMLVIVSIFISTVVIFATGAVPFCFYTHTHV